MRFSIEVNELLRPLNPVAAAADILSLRNIGGPEKVVA
jgi:hypothetical protein